MPEKHNFIQTDKTSKLSRTFNIKLYYTMFIIITSVFCISILCLYIFILIICDGFSIVSDFRFGCLCLAYFSLLFV